MGSGGYNWTQVSRNHWMTSVKRATGFHRNGTNAGSRVCIENSVTGKRGCGAAKW
ncbi:hypothetical protein MMF93_18385 [Streptomyces tubbatahanensis]|uniref:DUF397 domain-containing protein n=1 Tax=Streptomyces tubbatahanensis TaxID=2923272 RepID=A0ABY3XUP1_9ACTN|nr:hypothetical protein [Streptomyces tubbatahanensis]UNS98201.1 hypothetical protein MMF93_18385 [Streptomyces tubbatahanensis]